MPRAESIVLVNTGYGKGKSSAAFGVMGRGWARGHDPGITGAAAFRSDPLREARRQALTEPDR